MPILHDNGRQTIQNYNPQIGLIFHFIFYAELDANAIFEYTMDNVLVVSKYRETSNRRLRASILKMQFSKKNRNFRIGIVTQLICVRTQKSKYALRTPKNE